MPKSKKRVKKEKPEVEVAVKNPLHTKTGKAIVVILSAGFIIGILIGLGLALSSYLGR